MNLLTLKSVNSQWIKEVIDQAIQIKNDPGNYSEELKNKTLLMMFEKPSTRTRVSFETAMTQLGGHAIFLDLATTHFSKAHIGDEIKCLSRYTDIMMARVFEQTKIQEIGKYSDIPVINGLSNTYHPCQILGDLLTIKEKSGSFDGVNISYIGDGNNICNSLILGCKKLGINLKIACPKGYEPKESPDKIYNDPKDVIKGANYIYTDTWVSMGQEAEKAKRIMAFRGFQVNTKLLGENKPHIMHCLPATEYEIARDVLDSVESIVFDQAENRLHVQKAIILKMMDIV